MQCHMIKMYIKCLFQHQGSASVPTAADFDRKLSETDAYLQLLIDQVKVIIWLVHLYRFQIRFIWQKQQLKNKSYLILSILGNFSCFFLSSADFFSKLTFTKKKKKKFRNIIRVSNSLDTNQDQHFVGPDFGPNCLQSG